MSDEPSNPIWGYEERRNFILNNIPLSRWENESGNSILASLKAAGFGILRDDFFSIRELILKDAPLTDKILEIDSRVEIPLAFHREASFWNVPGNFQYKIIASVVDEKTGLVHQEYGTIVSNSRLSEDEIIEQMEENIINFENSMGGEIESANVVGAYHRPGLAP